MSDLGKLIEAAVRHDADAANQLAEEFGYVIEKECKKFGFWNQADWSQSDMTQEIHLKVWSRLDQFNGVHTENVRPVFISWLKKVSKSVLANWVRDRNVQKRKPDQKPVQYDEATQTFVNRNDDGHTYSPSSIYRNKETAENLNNALLDVLDEVSFKIIHLKIIEGVSLREISRRLDINYDSVCNLYHQSLNKLESIL